MSEILSEWLNQEVKLSRSLVPGSLSEEFSTGYLFGELLHKYGLQDNFNQFSQSRATNAKLNNFSLLEPTLHLLGVQFNENVAHDIMVGKHGAATKLLYELYIALEKMRKAKLTGVAMEAMRSAAPARLKTIGSVSFRERLKSLTLRHADMQPQKVSDYLERKSKVVEDKIARMHISEQQKSLKPQEEQKAQDTEKHLIGRRQNEIMARIQAAIIQVPKPSLSHTLKANEAKKLLKKKREAEDTYKEISNFEKSMIRNAFEVRSQFIDSEVQESLQTQKLIETALETTAQAATELLPTHSDDDYVKKIQKKLEEDTSAREQREKRRRKMLMEQLTAHEAEEEIYQEEQLIYKLMRQSQQERRIAVQLMHIRHEKEVLKQNRIFREKQYEERRRKEFQEALDREAALAKQEKIDCEEQIAKERELHEKIAIERIQARYKKHYSVCWEVIDQIVDLSTKVGEYRLLTNNKVPLKLMRDWKELFFHGKSIYEKTSIKNLPSEPSPEQLTELNKMDLLDEKDYGEYKSMTGEWCPTGENKENKCLLNNNILGHVLHRLMEIFYPSKPKCLLPVFPPFPIKGCILGKVFSGKTTCVKFLEKVCNVQVLSVDTLVQEAIQAFLNNEMKTEHTLISQEAECSAEQSKDQRNFSESSMEFPTGVLTSGTKGNHPVKKHPYDQEIVSVHKANDISMLSVRAQLGAASQELLKKGKSIPDELLVDILLEAINQTSPEKGWILDGFPMTINQARLFEKAYTGIDPDETEAECVNSRKLLLVEPSTPQKPLVALPAFDVSVLLDISDTTALKRVASLSDKSKPSQTEQEDNSQNSDVKIVEEKTDLARDDVLHRISSFLDTWPKLENWFSVHQNTLVKVNAETEESVVCKTVKEILIKEIVKNQNRKSEQEESPAEKALPDTPQDLLTSISETPLLTSISETPPLIKPGTDEWIYVDEPLPKEVPDFLVPYWEMVENVYVNTIKTVLRCLRDERYSLIYYLADIRKNFQDYLQRPDLKQEFVSQWQSDFNSISDELREDEETKAELHQRLTDLRDRLWDICDKRREEAEQERTDIMNDGWLRDHRGIAINHFFTLMQVEMDRFQDTKRLLHDYYRAMEGKIPTEDEKDFTRLPLLDIIDNEQKEDQNESRRIPLVPYKWPLPETSVTKSKSKGNLLKTIREENTSENVVVGFGKDENVICDTWQTAVTAVSEMVRAEEEMEGDKQSEMKEDMKSSQAASSKSTGKDTKNTKKSSKTPNKKKAEETPVPLTAEELRKQELTLKIYQEYLAALKHEEKDTITRLELIKEKALAYIEELTMKAEEVYKEMEQWLGARFLAEMSSVEKLIEVGRHHIESSSKIQYEMNLEQTDFFISNDVKVIPDPVPPPPAPPVETSDSNTLTISQLNTFHKHFLQVAPKAIRALKQFKGGSNSSSKREVGDRGKGKKDSEHTRIKKNRWFPKIWLTKYSWLKYDDERGIMFCALCRKHDVDLGERIHNFCSGTDDFKLEFINTHQNSEAHAWATCMEAASTASPNTASAEQVLKSVNSITIGRVESTFRTYHAIAKSDWPFTDLDWICKLDDVKGTDIGSVFRNAKSARMFRHCMAEVERKALKEKLENCKYFSLISDECTDSIFRSVAAVYVRFANEGKVHCWIVGIQPVQKNDASTIKSAIKETFQINLRLSLSSQDWSRKLVGLGTDGTDVVTGQNDGVANLVREIQRCVQSVHCFAYHLRLVYKKVLENIQPYSILTNGLRNVYYFYHNLTLNKNNIKAIYEAIKLHPAILSCTGGSQWFPRLQTALQILLNGYPAFVLHLNEIKGDSRTSNRQKVKGLLYLLLKIEIVKFSHFLPDVINALNILLCVTLDQNSSIADIFAAIQSTMETLQMYQTRASPKECLTETIQHFYGHHLAGNRNISLVRAKILSDLLKSLSDCFCDGNQDVLKATLIGSFKLWPNKMKQEFGEKEVSVLSKHYEAILESAGVKITEVETEWNMLKLELYNRFQNIQTLTWDSVNAHYSKKYPNILALVDLILTLPASSAKREQVFSQMKFIVMYLHFKLMSESVITDFMTIQMNSPDIKKCVLPKEIFIEIFTDLINSNLGTDYLPDAWNNLTPKDLHNLATAFSENTELIDWRRFMLAAAQPWPVPSVTQLLKTLYSFMSVDVLGFDFVTLKDCMQLGLWFNGSEDLSITEDCTKRLPFDRLGNLVKFFFSLFADTGRFPALLNYFEMLLYFASHSDPVEGVYRALCVATRTYIQRKESSLVCETFPYTSTKEDENELLNYRGEGVVSLETLLKVFHDGGSRDEDNQRFSSLETEGSYDKHFLRVYKELGSEDLTPLPLELLLKHPFIQELIQKYQGYKLHDIQFFLQRDEPAQTIDEKTTCNDSDV